MEWQQTIIPLLIFILIQWLKANKTRASWAKTHAPAVLTVAAFVFGTLQQLATAVAGIPDTVTMVHFSSIPTAGSILAYAIAPWHPPMTWLLPSQAFAAGADTLGTAAQAASVSLGVVVGAVVGHTVDNWIHANLIDNVLRKGVWRYLIKLVVPAVMGMGVR